MPSRPAGPVPPCVLSLDRLLRIVAANAEVFHLFRETVDGDLCGTSFSELLDPGVRAGVRDDLERLLDGRRDRLCDTPVVLRGRAGGLRGDLAAAAVGRGGAHPEGVVVLVRPGTSADSRRTLSDIQARVLEGVAGGASTVQLASTLFLSRGGVEYHVAALLRASKVTNRPALVAKAYATGLLEPGSWPPRVAPGHVR